MKKTIKEVALSRIKHHYAFSAKTYDRAWSLTDQDFETLLFANCHYCGRPPQTKCSPYLTKAGKIHGKVSVERAREVHILHNGIDRKDNTKGYSLDNCVTCCETCNRGKRAMSYEDFQNYLNELVKYRG